MQHMAAAGYPGMPKEPSKNPSVPASSGQPGHRPGMGMDGLGSSSRPGMGNHEHNAQQGVPGKPEGSQHYPEMGKYQNHPGFPGHPGPGGPHGHPQGHPGQYGHPGLQGKPDSDQSEASPRLRQLSNESSSSVPTSTVKPISQEGKINPFPPGNTQLPGYTDISPNKSETCKPPSSPQNTSLDSEPQEQVSQSVDDCPEPTQSDSVHQSSIETAVPTSTSDDLDTKPDSEDEESDEAEPDTTDTTEKQPISDGSAPSTSTVGMPQGLLKVYVLTCTWDLWTQE